MRNSRSSTSKVTVNGSDKIKMSNKKEVAYRNLFLFVHVRSTSVPVEVAAVITILGY